MDEEKKSKMYPNMCSQFLFLNLLKVYAKIYNTSTQKEQLKKNNKKPKITLRFMPMLSVYTPLTMTVKWKKY